MLAELSPGLKKKCVVSGELGSASLHGNGRPERSERLALGPVSRFPCGPPHTDAGQAHPALASPSAVGLGGAGT